MFSMRLTLNFWSYISRGCFPKLKTLTSLVLYLKVILMDLFLQLIIALAVVRNERPKITGVCDLGLETDYVSRTMKSMG